MVKLLVSFDARYHRVKRKADMRAAAKMTAGGDAEDENATEMLEKADRLRAMVRTQLTVFCVTLVWALELCEVLVTGRECLNTETII